MSSAEKYDRLAAGFSEREYADAVQYAARRAKAIVALGPRARRGQSVLDLGCGDGIMAAPLGGYGLVYSGVDSSEQMVEEARRRHPGLRFALSRSEDYEPPEQVDLTICLRAFYYPEDRVAFFGRVASYTRLKFVFDFREAVHARGPIVRDLRAAGFSRIELRPFFTPQNRRIPGPALPLIDALEHTGPLASALSHRIGRIFCSATV
ncbi:MAG TPA: methyltransferase domain-containing protein [Gaiellaceae bacterium]|nr:methyltransferase domain-containing protein [Gaiellaceae bacterium]